jgi:putative thioredoxin
LFVDGEVKAEFTGALPEPKVEEWINKNIPGKSSRFLEEISILIKSGRKEDALRMLSQLKDKEPDNPEIDILFAQITLFDNPRRASELVKLQEITETGNSVIMIAELLLRLENKDFPEGEEKENYVKAAQYLKEQNFDKAVEMYINIIRQNRAYDKDGARKACVAIFKYLGEDHTVTIKYRRDFGSALYV